MLLSPAFSHGFLSKVHEITFHVRALSQSKLSLVPVRLRLYKVTALLRQDFRGILTLLILQAPSFVFPKYLVNEF